MLAVHIGSTQVKPPVVCITLQTTGGKRQVQPFNQLFSCSVQIAVPIHLYLPYALQPRNYDCAKNANV